MLDDFFDREERIIVCHEQLQLAYRRNFVNILKSRNVPIDPATLNLKIDRPTPLIVSAEESKSNEASETPRSS
jgi:hypothetical protein